MNMRLNIQLQHRLEQRMKLAPQIIMSIEILQLPALELADHIAQELLENPALEISDTGEDAGDEEPQTQIDHEIERQEEAGDESTESGAVETEIEKALDAMDEYDREWSESMPKSGDGGEAAERKLEAMNNTAARPESLADRVLSSFHLLEVPARIKAFGEYMIYDLDQNGLLQYSLEEIRADYNTTRVRVDPFMAVSRGESEAALHALQQIKDPAGVGARDARECLLLQLDASDPNHELKRNLIANHLEDIQKNRLPRIEKATGKGREEIKAAIHEIQALSLKPGAEHGDDRRHYVQPDVIVEFRDGKWEIILENSYLPPLRVSRWVRSLMEKERAAGKNGGGLSKEEKEYLVGKFEAARRLIDAIQQRQSTLERVARAIFGMQQGFLEGGISELRPLKMAQIADALGIHVSTVSRAIADKWVQTPRGIFPLKFFFTGGTANSEGDDISRVSVKQLVKKIVDDEDRSNPLSDEDIAKILEKQQGLEIARRTVTKYRKSLKIPSSRQRREY